MPPPAPDRTPPGDLSSLPSTHQSSPVQAPLAENDEALLPSVNNPLLSPPLPAPAAETTARQRLIVLGLLICMFIGTFFSLFTPPPAPLPLQLALISIDGFAHSYIDRRLPDSGAFSAPGGYAAPTLRALAAGGSSASMRPCFPSKTFPCHSTLATGLWPGSHGIVGNTMYDRATRRWFHVSEHDPRWWGGEPIWRTLSKAGRKTATVFWPGSTVVGRRADAYWDYNGTVSYADRVNRVIDLLQGRAPDLQGQRASFVTLYFNGVDHAGHRHGPDSVEVTRAIQAVDAAVADLLARAPTLSLVIVSDHGMAELSDARVVDLDGALRAGAAFSVVKSPVLLLMNASAAVETIYRALSGAQRDKGHLRAFRRADLPERWHLREAPHLAPVVAVADVGWTLKLDHAPAEAPAVRVELGGSADAPNHPHRGEHGYDNVAQEMQALFIASGPAFHASGEVEGMEAVDVYPLLCEVFGVSPAPNNGSRRRTQPLVRSRI